MYSVLQDLLECMHLAAAACKPVTVLGDLNLNLKNNTVEKKTYEPITVYGLAYESNQIELILPNKSGPITASLRDQRQTIISHQFQSKAGCDFSTVIIYCLTFCTL